jgi:hypothetical protein
MAFDLHITLSESSREVQIIQQVATQEHITPEQAATRLIIEGAKLHGQKSPAEQMWGAFSSEEDSAITDEAMKHVRAMRQTDQLRDFGL